MPKLGMRIVKSSAAVFLCFLVNDLLGLSPFYSAIAAVLCIQQDLRGSCRVALNRTVGTFIGGAAGMATLVLWRAAGFPAQGMLYYTVLSLLLIPLMYLTVLLEKTPATYITCVVFFSITVSHGADLDPILFALTRIGETLLGILIALGVNMLIHAPAHKVPDTALKAADTNEIKGE